MQLTDIVAVVPARDEAPSIARVVTEIKSLSRENRSPLFSRIVVCDNGSSDGTAKLAAAAGAEVVIEPSPGYGSACLAALSSIDSADIIVFIDADASLNLKDTHLLLSAIDAGADLVVGSRPVHKRQSGSMTMPQIFGNWLASLLIRVIWQKPVTDLGPFRAIRFDTLQKLEMSDRSFGWTVEMQVKAIQHQVCMVEVPVEYRRRIGRSKISGTLEGVIGAGIGIISTIFKLAIKPQAKPKIDPAK